MGIPRIRQRDIHRLMHSVRESDVLTLRTKWSLFVPYAHCCRHIVTYVYVIHSSKNKLLLFR